VPLFFAILIFVIPGAFFAVLAGQEASNKRYREAAYWAWMAISMSIFAAAYQISTAIEARP
jgi:hypothetical protein